MKTIFSEINKRNFGLDLFRAIAVMAVVLGHGSEFINVGVKSWFPVDGVDMFFVLSGFLIGNILLKNDRDGKSFLTKTATFYKRRWFRTLPNYFLFLVVNIILVKAGIYDGILNLNVLAYFAFLQNFTFPLDLMFWESWSLAVEEWFYLLFPLLILISLTISENKSNYKKHYLIMCLAFLTVPLILRIVSFDPSYKQTDVDLYIRKIVIFRLDTIAFGLLGAYISKFHKKVFSKPAIPMLITGITGIAFIKSVNFDPGSFFRQTIFFSLQSLFIFLWIPAFIRISKAPVILSKPVGFISITSYALYLTHMPVLYLIKRYELSTGFNTIDFIIYVLTSIVISFIIYKFWERPLTNLRNKDFSVLGLKV